MASQTPNRAIQIFTQAGLVCIRMRGYVVEEVEDGSLCPVLRFDSASVKDLIEALKKFQPPTE